MNINTFIANRAAEILAANKTGIKSYGSEAAAEKATAVAAQAVAVYFSPLDVTRPRSAMYVVVFVPSMGRWVGGINLTEVLARQRSTGGYLGVQPGFIKF